MEPKSWKDWKDHPVILMGGVFIAGVGFAATILVPAYTASLQNRLEKQADKISRVMELESKVAGLEEAKSDIQSKLDGLMVIMIAC